MNLRGKDAHLGIEWDADHKLTGFAEAVIGLVPRLRRGLVQRGVGWREQRLACAAAPGRAAHETLKGGEFILDRQGIETRRQRRRIGDAHRPLHHTVDGA
jgi:hypothetical protein